MGLLFTGRPTPSLACVFFGVCSFLRSYPAAEEGVVCHRMPGVLSAVEDANVFFFLLCLFVCLFFLACCLLYFPWGMLVP